MRRPGPVRLAGGLFLLLVLSGCGSGANQSITAPAIKSYAVGDLPAVSHDLPPLDEGRIELPTPTGWSPMSRKRDFVAVFQIGGRTGFPQISVTSQPHPGPDTTRENLLDFVQQVQEELDAESQEKKISLLEPARALMLGNNPYARYVLSAKRQGKEIATLERQILRTVQGGRIYSIELVVSEDLLTHRNFAYAMAAGAKFHAPAEEPKAKEDGPAPKAE